jgi:hypothetical protein
MNIVSILRSLSQDFGGAVSASVIDEHNLN